MKLISIDEKKEKNMNDSKPIPQDTREKFRELGTCSRTFFYLLNREFGYPVENEERAAAPLAGGIQRGHQCGMLWGSALAVGAESYRRFEGGDQAVGLAITATQHLVESFSNRTKSVNCRDVTGYDFSRKFDLVKYMARFIFLGDRSCFELAEKWAPEAIQSASRGLSHEQPDLTQKPISCASEVAKKMGAGDEETIMVAGYAGGLGLSGAACGALGAAIWLKTLTWCREHPGKSPPYFNNPDMKKKIAAFAGATDSEFLCHKICGRRFNTISDHTEFIENGGCDKLIDVLAQ
jgi:hypothetical protein